MELDAITLEDGKDYLIIDIIDHDNNKYLVLTTEDNADFCLRKLKIIDGKEYIIKLESNEELEAVLKKYNEKEKGE